jgi:hypothetical protein
VDIASELVEEMAEVKELVVLDRRTLAREDRRGKPSPSIPEICCEDSVRLVELMRPVPVSLPDRTTLPVS